MTSTATDNFKKCFKEFRGAKDTSSCTTPVFNFDLSSNKSIPNCDVISPPANHICKPVFALIPVESWRIHRFDFPKGLIFIRNPFTPEGQRYWISKTVTEYIAKPSRNNIDNLAGKLTDEGDQNKAAKQRRLLTSEELKQEHPESFYTKLRWVTFGYHHNWDTKVYSEDNKCTFPPDLADLTKYLALALGFTGFKAEAAIVNYYNLDSSLSGHQDYSEFNQEAPLFSISFGQSALFLIGGPTKDTTPLVLHVDSGDVIIMSGESRRSYHGVPKVIETKDAPWLEPEPNSLRVPSIPQDLIDLDSKVSSSSSVTLHPCPLCSLSLTSVFAKSETQRVLQGWGPLLETYAKNHRVNMNVRQVLKPTD